MIDDSKQPELGLPNTEIGIGGMVSDEKVSKLQDIFKNKPLQEIKQAVRMSDGNLNLAAQQLSGNDQGKVLQSVEVLYVLLIYF